MLRVHVQVVLRLQLSHEPCQQRRSVQLTVPGADSSHVDDQAQLPQEPHVVAPHHAPSVLRVQVHSSVQVSVEHQPPEHRGPEQLLVPDAPWSHVLEYVHPPQAVQVALPHDCPLVSRVHRRDSVRVVLEEQAPPEHTGVEQERVCVPSWSQAHE